MFSFDNNHIFTGYLKQLLSTVSIPACKIYTNEYSKHLTNTGREDPRIVESFGVMGSGRPLANVNYLKNNEVCNLYYNLETGEKTWKARESFYYDKDKFIPGLTRRLKNLGSVYNSETHEYLGEFLRFLRDYYNINLMSLYNCFNNKIYSNIDFTYKTEITLKAETADTLAEEDKTDTQAQVITKVKELKFDSTDPKYRIYAFPVKLFSDYTIAIDCSTGIEVFCGLYCNYLDTSNKALDLFKNTYQRIDTAMFHQPILYDKLSTKYWTLERELEASPENELCRLIQDTDHISRCDIINREQDLKLFIKVPATCMSSITVLEGDYRTNNDCIYAPHIELTNAGSEAEITKWDYEANHAIVNFEKKADLNTASFKPISKLQLLAFNTGESYPFADRLVEYLSGSAIIPIDGITDNIKRAQKVMSQNNHYFRIAGIWEPQMQKIAYDYMMAAGPIEYSAEEDKLVDRRHGRHPKVGLVKKSTLYDVLGYIDRDVEKFYASWKRDGTKSRVINSIQNVDIYNGLYDI